jgi:hypothetical protein
MGALWSHRECSSRAEVGNRAVMSGLGIGSAYWIMTAAVQKEELGDKGITTTKEDTFEKVILF